MSLKKEITSGVFWIALAKYSGLFISLGITAILSRNIAPSAFGTMAVATVIMAFLEIFTDIGIGSSVIQFKDLTKKDLNTLFTIGNYLGIFLTLLLFFFSVPIGNYYQDPNLIYVCRILCICLLFKSLNIVPNGLMLRNKRFKTVSIRTFVFHVLGGSIAVWGALHKWEIYALIVAPLISSIGVFIFNFINYPQRFITTIYPATLKKVWSYSAFQFLFSITNYFSRNLDKLIIGKHFSMTELGYYDKSYRLMQLPLQNITFVIAPVLHPILSSLQHDPTQLNKKNIKLVTLLSQLSFPIGIILFFCASEIIKIIFGPNWEPAVPVFKILALSLPLQMILSTCGSIFLAAGKSNHLFYTGIINTIITVIGFVLAANYFKSIESMAWAWDITLMLGFLNSYSFMCRYTFNESFIMFLKSFTPQILNSSIVVIIFVIIQNYIHFDIVFLSFLVKVFIILASTCVMAYLIHQYNILQIIRQIVLRLNIHGL